MSRSTPPAVVYLRGKQREMHQRDERVLDSAQRIFKEEGYQAVTIERIARELGFSRGTLYLRFSSKEALVLELALRCRVQLNALMEYASRIPERPRERMVAIGEAISQHASLCADNLRTLVAIDTEIIVEKAPSELANRMRDAEQATTRILLDIVEEAMAAGDLDLPKKATPGALCLALLALIHGWADIQRRPNRVKELQLSNPPEQILLSAHRLMDGYGWRPFHQEWDYEQVYDRVAEALRGYSNEDVLRFQEEERKEVPARSTVKG